ncbi:hypothetical protein [Micromonospora sp. 4G55]|uniref:hypothetical protein n=1 Tax=Micromonospora sp. 4G55 TaxID=2806102 RepID=UPI001A62CF9A|nr:hypothetical protein [Micromonospora sp. 4G55]MBM0258122.1 hypothetical protein [Micromonospora sp. 4G55]
MTKVRDKVHVWPRALATAAFLTSAITATWLTLGHENGPVWLVAWWLPVVIMAIQLFAVRREPFEAACLAGGVLLLFLMVPGICFLVSFHLPATLLVLAAPATDPQRGRGVHG